VRRLVVENGPNIFQMLLVKELLTYLLRYVLCVCRVFRVRLNRDDAVYSPDITVENDTHVVSFDANRAFRGHVEGLVPSLRYCAINFVCSYVLRKLR